MSGDAVRAAVVRLCGELGITDSDLNELDGHGSCHWADVGKPCPEGRVEPGLYRHWKGDHYLVLFTAQDSNNNADREPVVVYYSLGRQGFRVRRVKEFTELIPDGGGRRVPRFVRVGHV